MLFGLDFGDLDAVGLVATVAAGAYFLWKLYSGFFIMNLALTSEAERAAADDNSDHLSITVRLVKGDLGGTMAIHDARVVITGVLDSTTRIVAPLEALGRYTYGGSGRHKQLNLDEPSGTKLRIQLPPGDEMTVTAYGLVPAE